jgi:hypothetical protein
MDQTYVEQFRLLVLLQKDEQWKAYRKYLEDQQKRARTAGSKTA